MTRSLPIAVAARGHDRDWHREATPSRPLRVALVNMPWADPSTPSIQCGLLKAGLQRYGHAVDVMYLNLDLSARIGPKLYFAVSDDGGRQDFLGEWLFGEAAFPNSHDSSAYLRDRAQGEAERPGLTDEDLVELRNVVLPGWVADTANAADWAGYDIVGFTSTFEQNVASLALCRAIKERHPDLITVFGGANFDTEMGP